MKRFWLFLFLLLIPTQLGKHFWPEWSYVLGIRVDYLSPTLYLLDIIWIVGLIFNFKTPLSPDEHRETAPLDKREPIFTFKKLLILGFVGVNILTAVSPWVAVYKWLRIGQIYLTWIYFRKNKTLIRNSLIKVILCWIIFESLLAVAQMANNGSLNGIFYWLGERNFTFNTIGIAQMSVFENGLIRAYGTFSHPNSLAGFLMVSLLLWCSKSLSSSGFLPLTKGRLKNVWWWVVFWLGIMGILVSGSRTIWILSLILMILFLLKKIKNKVAMAGIVLVFLGMVILASNFLSGWDKNGIEKRMQLNWAGLKMIKESPWFGVGAGNFLVRLPEFQKSNGIYWLQPVHNILILMVSEVGILGLGLLIFNLINISLNKVRLFNLKILIFGVILISGMVDHYWLTLPQNVWLLVLVLGIA